MSKISPRIGRAALVGVIPVALAATLSVVPAEANPAAGAGAIRTDLNYDPGCSVTSTTGPSTADYGLAAPGKWQTKNLSHSVVLTASGDPSDISTVTSTARTSSRRVVQGGELRSFQVNGTVSAAVAESATSACDASGTTQVVTMLNGHTSRDLWMVSSLNSTSTNPASYIVLATASSMPPPELTVLTGANLKANSAAKIDAGTSYAINQSFQVDTEAGSTHTASATIAMSLTFYRMGEASAPTYGSGRSYVAPPASLSCATSSMAVPFTAKGRGLKAASFTVNGKKKVSVKGPFGKGLAASLSGLSPTATNTVKATLTLKSGKKLTATRTYLPCA